MVLESTFILQERPRSSMKMGVEVGDMVFDVPMMDFAPGNLVRLIRERSEAKTRAVPRAESRVVFRRESVFFGTKKSVLNFLIFESTIQKDCEHLWAGGREWAGLRRQRRRDDLSEGVRRARARDHRC